MVPSKGCAWKRILLACLSYYGAIHLIRITPASTITSSTRIFATILAVPVLGERISLRLALGTILVVSSVWLPIQNPLTLRLALNSRKYKH